VRIVPPDAVPPDRFEIVPPSRDTAEEALPTEEKRDELEELLESGAESAVEVTVEEIEIAEEEVPAEPAIEETATVEPVVEEKAAEEAPASEEEVLIEPAAEEPASEEAPAEAVAEEPKSEG